MTLDRYSARALVDANMMSIRDYVKKYGQALEKEPNAFGVLMRYSRRPFFAGLLKPKITHHA